METNKYISCRCLNRPDAESSAHLLLQAGQYAKLCWAPVFERDLTGRAFEQKPFEVVMTSGSEKASEQRMHRSHVFLSLSLFF